MSAENVEIVKAVGGAINRGDWDAVFQDVAPDAEFDWSRSLGPYRGVYGPAQIRRRLVDEFSGTFESIRIEEMDFLDAGEHVLAPFVFSLKGRDGIEITARGSWVWTIRDGMVVRVCLYQDDQHQEALEAAGLEE
jgi:ketosteroid isomerase-like protein